MVPLAHRHDGTVGRGPRHGRRDVRGVSTRSGAGDEVGLERSDVDVESTIETEGGSEGGNNLSDKVIEVGVGRALNVEGATANVVEGSLRVRKPYWRMVLAV